MLHKKTHCTSITESNLWVFSGVGLSTLLQRCVVQLSQDGSCNSFNTPTRLNPESRNYVCTLHSLQAAKMQGSCQLMLFGTVFFILTAVRTSNPTYHLKTQFLVNNIYKFSPYLAGSTLRLHYKAQPVNAVWGNSRCLL
jgi:hypothetical protein